MAHEVSKQHLVWTYPRVAMLKPLQKYVTRIGYRPGPFKGHKIAKNSDQLGKQSFPAIAIGGDYENSTSNVGRNYIFGALFLSLVISGSRRDMDE